MMTMLCANVQNVYEIQKEKMLLGKKLVFTTLDFDVNVQHPCKLVVVTIRKFQVAINTLAQVAWNFVNHG
jgi:hypothetical protein